MPSPDPAARDRLPETPRLVLGLGNPGSEYRDTRHNLGFRVVQTLAERLRIRVDRLECRSLVGTAGGVTLAMPQTYMNRSGYAARCLAERHGFEPAGMLVVFDEIALPLGKIRLRGKGGPGGHRGMESILQNLTTDEVPRLRLGICGEDAAPAGDELVDYVLEPFREDELEAVESMIERAADACEGWLREGTEATMNRFNA